jgi:hypothetical protein
VHAAQGTWLGHQTVGSNREQLGLGIDGMDALIAPLPGLVLGSQEPRPGAARYGAAQRGIRDAVGKPPWRPTRIRRRPGKIDRCR